MHGGRTKRELVSTMSSLNCYAVTTEAEEVLTTSLETILQVRGTTNGHSMLFAWGIGFDGVSSVAEPVRVRLLRQSTDGTATAAAEVPFAEDAATAGCTAFHSFTAEPTPGVVLWEGHVHPQGGRIDFMYPEGREIVIDNAATSRLAIDVLAPAAVSCTAYMYWEE